MKTTLLFLSLLVITLSSCKKDKENNDCAVTVETLAGSYKLKALIYTQSAGSGTQDWYQDVVTACKKDDVYVLAANGAFNILDMGTVCDPSGSFEGAWSLDNNFINMDGFYAGTVESYNCETLVFSQTDALVDGDKLTATFEKQ